MNSRLLMDDHPLVVQPALATVIGLNEAIVLQQVHYWLQNNRRAKRNVIDEDVWCYNSIPEWVSQFPFWSERTIWQVLKSLRKSDLLVAEMLSPDKRDRTLWYTINYEKLEALTMQAAEVASSIPQELRDASLQKLRDVYKETETTTETTTETKDIAPRKKTRDGLGEAYEAFKKIWNQDKPELSASLVDNEEVRTRLRPHVKRLGVDEFLRRVVAALVFVRADRFSSETRPCPAITLLRNLDSYAEQGNAAQIQRKREPPKPSYETTEEYLKRTMGEDYQ